MNIDLYISKDKMEAKIIYLPHSKKDQVDYKTIIENLQNNKIVYGIEKSRIKEGLELLKSGKSLVKYRIAKGLQPDMGKRVEIKSNFNIEYPDPEQFYSNEKISNLLKYKNSFVNKGELILSITQAIKGKAGVNIFGEAVPYPKREDIIFEVDERSVFFKDDKYYALVSGFAYIENNKIFIKPPIKISEDKMLAEMVIIPGMCKNSDQDIKKFLEMLLFCGIKKGIDNEKIKKIFYYIKKCDKAGLFAIARGQKPISGMERFKWDIYPKMLNINKYFKDLDLIEREDIVKLQRNLVKKGDKLGDILSESDGVGWNVLGEEISENRTQQFEIVPGKGVEIKDGKFVAKYYGVAQIREFNVEVIPIIEIPDSKMRAKIILLGDKIDSYEGVEAILKDSGIVYGIDKDKITDMLEQVKTGIFAVSEIVARGILPEDGTPERVVSLLKKDYSVGKEDEKGKIDFKDRSFVNNVYKGDIIGKKIAQIEPKDGINIFGDPIKGGWKTIESITIGENIDEVEKGSDILYVASTDGIGVKLGTQLHVFDMVEVSGDISLDTGNIDAEGGVHIMGSVKSDFIVKADGDVMVEGFLENGTIISTGNVVIKRGVVGNSSKIICDGDLGAEFINNAEVKVKGSIYVEREIYNCDILCENEVKATNKKGVIVGGKVFASGGIIAKTIGSSMGTPTIVGIKVDGKAEKIIKKIEKEIEDIDYEIEKIQKMLGVEFIKNPMEVIKKASPGGRKVMLGKLHELSEFSKKKSDFENRLGRVYKEAEKNMNVKIMADMIHFGVVIKFGKKSVKIGKEIRKGCFRKNKKGNIVNT